MDGATIWMIVWFTFLLMVTALLLSPPTFISDLIDGDHKRKKKTDWTDEED